LGYLICRRRDARIVRRIREELGRRRPLTGRKPATPEA
jgi:hypothetical protein